MGISGPRRSRVVHAFDPAVALAFTAARGLEPTASLVCSAVNAVARPLRCLPGPPGRRA
jgi:hypothetical protein